MQISLHQFLITGALGGLTIGMSQDDVLLIAGQPDAKGGISRKYSKPNVWKYGGAELFFNRIDYRCTTIYIERLGNETLVQLPRAWTVDDWDLPYGSTERQVERFLSRQNVPYHSTYSAGAAEVKVKLSNVSIRFDDMGQMWSIASSEGNALPPSIRNAGDH